MTIKLFVNKTLFKGLQQFVSRQARSSLISIQLSGYESLTSHHLNILCSKALDYTKVYYSYCEEQDESNSGTVLASKVKKTLTYEEFRIFFFALGQYFMYCQVSYVIDYHN